MKTHPYFSTVFIAIVFTIFFHIPAAQAIIIFTNEFLGNEGETAVIDSDGNATGSISLKFGETENQTLVWDITLGRFILSNQLTINGALDMNGTTFTLDADNSGVGSTVEIVANQGSDADGVLRYNTTTNQWEISNNGGGFAAISTSGAANAFVQNGNSFGTAATLGTNDNNILAFEVNNTERMRINTAGDVGIGATTIPANKRLTVSNTAAPTFTAAGNGMGVSMSGGGGIYMKNSTDNVEGKFESFGGAIQVGVSGTVQAPLLLSYDGGFPGARLDTSGHFSIGQTTAGSYRLDVQHSGAGALDTARLQNNQAATINNGSSLLFAANRTTGGMTNIASIGGIITDIANAAYKGSLIFRTANNGSPAERMRIDHLGRVGINEISLTDRASITESTSTTSTNALRTTYTQLTNATNIIGQAINIIATPSGDAGDTLRGILIESITGTASTEQALMIGEGWDRDIVFSNNTPKLQMPDSGTLSVTNTTGTSVLSIDAQNNTISGGAFIGYYSQFSEEFMRDIPDLTADGNRTWGDSGHLSVDENNNCTFSVVDDLAGGIGRMNINNANTNCMAYFGTGAGNPQLIFNVENLPTVLMKVRPSTVGAAAQAQIWVGLTDQATSNSTGPTNGIFFYNNSGTEWVGATENGGTITNVPCSETISTTNFALLKIEVLSSTAVRFSVDPDISNGLSFTTCGTSATNIPATNISPNMLIHSSSGGRSLYIDFFRAWQI